MSKLVRISRAAAKNLEDLVTITGKPRQHILQKALEEHLKKEFIIAANNAVSQYKTEDPQGWQEFTQELQEWDATISSNSLVCPYTFQFSGFI